MTQYIFKYSYKFLVLEKCKSMMLHLLVAGKFSTLAQRAGKYFSIYHQNFKDALNIMNHDMFLLSVIL